MGLMKATESARLHPVAVREYPRDTPGLMAQLRAADPGVRRWAARDLAGSPEAATALGSALGQEQDASVREAIFTTLSMLRTPEAVDGLLPLLRSEDAALRNAAIETLAHMPDAVAVRIDRLLRDADVDVRIFTVNLLGLLSHPGIGAWLTQVLTEEHAVNVVGAALEVATELGGPEHLAAIDTVRQRFASDPFIGFAAEVARTRIEAAG